MGKYMDICIGGPWHGSKFLTNISQKSERFKAKDEFGNIVRYNKKIIQVGNRRLAFWVDSSLSIEEVRELIEDLLRIKLSAE